MSESPRSPYNSRGTLSFSHNIKKKPNKQTRISPLHARWGPFTMQHFPRNPTSLLSVENELDTLYETPEASWDLYPHSRATLSFQLQLEEPCFPLLNSRWGSIPLLCLERNPEVPVTPQEEAGLTLKLNRNPRGSCHNPKDTDFPIHSR